MFSKFWCGLKCIWDTYFGLQPPPYDSPNVCTKFKLYWTSSVTAMSGQQDTNNNNPVLLIHLYFLLVFFFLNQQLCKDSWVVSSDETIQHPLCKIQNYIIERQIMWIQWHKAFSIRYPAKKFNFCISIHCLITSYFSFYNIIIMARNQFWLNIILLEKKVISLNRSFPCNLNWGLRAKKVSFTYTHLDLFRFHPSINTVGLPIRSVSNMEAGQVYF